MNDDKVSDDNISENLLEIKLFDAPVVGITSLPGLPSFCDLIRM